MSQAVEGHPQAGLAARVLHTVLPCFMANCNKLAAAPTRTWTACRVFFVIHASVPVSFARPVSSSSIFRRLTISGLALTSRAAVLLGRVCLSGCLSVCLSVPGGVVFERRFNTPGVCVCSRPGAAARPLPACSTCPTSLATSRQTTSR